MLTIAGGIILGTLGLFVIYFVFLIVTGNHRVPNIGKGLVEGWRGFVEGMKGVKDDRSKRD